MCLKLVQGHQTCLMGPKEYHVCLHVPSTTGKIQLLQQTSYDLKFFFHGFLQNKFAQSTILYVYEYVLPSQDCCPLRRLYPAVHMQALVVGEVGRHSWEQSPLLLLQRLVPGNTKA